MTVERVSGTGIPLRGDDVDTDQIVPGRFLKLVTFDGLGDVVFFDERFEGATPEESRDRGGDSAEQCSADRSSGARRERREGLDEANGEAVSGQSPREEAAGADDEPREHPFNDERHEDASILVVNRNFGCGSSREHAPQALQRWGIDAIVGQSFAEIFAGNCLALGIPTVTAPPDAIADLQRWIERHPDERIVVDVAAETVTYGETTVDGSVDDPKRAALLEGLWDSTAVLGANTAAVAETIDALPYTE